MCYTSTFWKCIWFEDIGSMTKVMSMKVKNVTWRFCPFFFFWNGRTTTPDGSLPISTLSFSRIVSSSASTFDLRIATQRVKMLAHLLPCLGVTGKWHLSRNSYAGPAIWRENNGAKMTSRSRQKFPAQLSEAKRDKITIPHFSFLTAADLTPKEDFEQLFNFQGPVISECTIVLTKDQGSSLLASLEEPIHLYLSLYEVWIRSLHASK